MPSDGFQSSRETMVLNDTTIPTGAVNGTAIAGHHGDAVRGICITRSRRAVVVIAAVRRSGVARAALGTVPLGKVGWPE